MTAEAYHFPYQLHFSTTVAVALKLENVKKVFDSRSASAKKNGGSGGAELVTVIWLYPKLLHNLNL